MHPISQPRTLAAGLWILVGFAVGYLLLVAQALLIPLVLAVFLWYLLNTVATSFGSVRLGAWRAPRWLQFMLAGLTLLLGVNLVIGIIASSVGELIAAAPAYQENLRRLVDTLQRRFDFIDVPAASQVLTDLNLGALIRGIAASFGNLVGNIGLIGLYLLFLFLEQRYFSAKLAAVLHTQERQRSVERLLAQIDRDVRNYIGIKTLVSAGTSLASWLVMHWVGLDFAAFWALLIFVLNFIPNIGSIIATSLPSLLALIQFDTITPFLIILLGIGSIQMLVGNVLEPQLMGKSLNVSPLAIILSLVIWGFMWGIPGMFLAVPITVVAMIIFSHFESTRWIALLMSQDGRLRRSDEAP
jgi:AI-2 transport protein TqsA